VKYDPLKRVKGYLDNPKELEYLTFNSMEKIMPEEAVPPYKLDLSQIG